MKVCLKFSLIFHKWVLNINYIIKIILIENMKNVNYLVNVFFYENNQQNITFKA